MTKADIVKQIHSRTGISSATVATIVDSLIAVIKENMLHGHNIHFRGFGSFLVKRHAPRHAYNINQGSHYILPSHATPVFRPGSDLLSSIR